MANIELPEEVGHALSYGAEGVGLFRLRVHLPPTRDPAHRGGAFRHLRPAGAGRFSPPGLYPDD